MPRRSKNEARMATVVVVGLLITALVAAGVLAYTYVLPFAFGRPFSSVGPNGSPAPSLTVNGQTSGVVANGNVAIAVSGLTAGGTAKIVMSSAPVGATNGGTSGGQTTTTSSPTVSAGLQTTLTVTASEQGSPTGANIPLGNVPVTIDGAKVGTTDYTGTYTGPISTGQHTIACGSVSGLNGPSPASFSVYVSGATSEQCAYSPTTQSGSATISVLVTVGANGVPLNNYQVLLFDSLGNAVSASNSNCIVNSNGNCVSNANGLVTFQTVAPNSQFTVCNAGTFWLSGKCGAFSTTVNTGNVGTVVTANLAIQISYSAFTSQGLILSTGTASSTGTYSASVNIPSGYAAGTTLYLTALDPATGLYSNSVDVTVGQATDSCTMLQTSPPADTLSKFEAQFNCGVFQMTGFDPAGMSLMTKFALVGIVVAIIALVAYGIASTGKGRQQQPTQFAGQPIIVVR